MARHKEGTQNRLSKKERRALKKQKRMDGGPLQSQEGPMGQPKKVNGNKGPSSSGFLRMGKRKQIAVPYDVLEAAAESIARKKKEGQQKPTPDEVSDAEDHITAKLRNLVVAFELDGPRPRFGSSMIKIDSVQRNLRRDNSTWGKKAAKDLASWLRQRKMITERGKAKDMTVCLSNNVAEMAAPWGEVMGAVYRSIHSIQ